MAKVIVIDGQISPWYFSKSFVREMLKGETGRVDVKLSSLGGSFDHALDIFEQFKNHKQVYVDMTGFNASSATIIALGAAHTKASKYSFYLIHKVMAWVDEWGTMNEDQLAELIKNLESQKNDLEKMTLSAAQMYHKKSGKSIQDILNLMKEDKWLTADEAKDWGFIDEVYEAGEDVTNAVDEIKIAMITASGYPAPPKPTRTQEPPAATSEKIDIKSIISDAVTEIKNFFKPHDNQMKQQFKTVNEILNVEKLESDNDGVFLHETQLESIENKLVEGATAAADKVTAENALTSATSELDAIDSSVKEAKTVAEKVAAIKALIAAKPGTAPAGAQTIRDPQAVKTDADWDTINNLPHNQVLD